MVLVHIFAYSRQWQRPAADPAPSERSSKVSTQFARNRGSSCPSTDGYSSASAFWSLKLPDGARVHDAAAAAPRSAAGCHRCSGGSDGALAKIVRYGDGRVPNGALRVSAHERVVQVHVEEGPRARRVSSQASKESPAGGTTKVAKCPTIVRRASSPKSRWAIGLSSLLPFGDATSRSC
ncbi:hypothetical protein BKA93DRAFT_516505 [Sparassis latifolia]